MRAPATLPLLVEIGCEEIPARFLGDAERQFAHRLRTALEEAGLLEKSGAGNQKPEVRTQKSGEDVSDASAQFPALAPVASYSTPRRLIVHAARILAHQPDRVQDVMGPAVKVAFDASGKPTRAAERFAAKNGVKVEELLKVETPKGLYLAAKRTTHGLRALQVLSSLIPQVIRDMNFPKSMVWESSGLRFVRPIRWILALLGEGESAQVVPFEVAGVRSGNETFGHRSLGPGAVRIEGLADYAQTLRQRGVEFDPENRRQSVRSEINVLLEDWLVAVEDKELEEWIVNSTEWLSGVRGDFDAQFLHLPREILVTVMRDHQKYFAVQDDQGRLRPHFIALLNRDRDRTGEIQAGHERVLAARFSDAQFFWQADQKVPLRKRYEDGWLDRVTYHERLGSYGDKIRRMKAIAAEVCLRLEEQRKITGVGSAHALRAIELCKCDLTTQMVQEFTELQGVVGGLYAKAQGELEEVWEAVYDHYKPVNIEDACPRSVVGAVVSLADKLDAVVGGFSVGLEPTGSSDPFGLRRAGNGTIKIVIETLAGTDLLGLVEAVVRKVGLPEVSDLFGTVAAFLRERTEYFLQAWGGLRYDTIRAVVQSFKGWSPPLDALERGRSLEQVRDTEDFRALATAAKRTRNILSKSATLEDFGGLTRVDSTLLRAPEERDLYDACEAARKALDGSRAQADYAAAFRRLAELRPAVDQFFDRVMVMDEDLALRANRLRLLSDLNALVFSRFADLSEIETAGPGQARA